MAKKRKHTTVSEMPYQLEQAAKQTNQNESQMEDLRTCTSSAISCRFCNEQFTDAHSICRHLIFNHFETLSRCLICSRLFKELHQLKEHVEKHRSSSKGVFKCSSCMMSFYNKILLRNHETLHETSDPSNGIYLDDLSTSLTEILRMNIKNFIKNLRLRKPKYDCVSCGKSFLDLALYFQHIRETHIKDDDNVDKIFVCHTCCAVYNNKRALAKHIFKKHKSQSEMFTCNCCKKEFDSKMYLSEHVRRVHKIYKCSKCNNEYRQNKSYLQHLPKCLGKKQKKFFKCTDCDIAFKTPNDLYVHNQICNQRMLYIKDCQYCGVTLPNGEALKTHERRHALRITTCKYKCFYCELRFSVPLRLIQHFAGKHRAEKPFKCDICDVTFKKRKEFTYHIKLDHEMKGTVKIDDVNGYVLFVAVDASRVKEQKECEDNLVTLTETQALVTPGTNNACTNPAYKNNECTNATQSKSDDVESCARNSPNSESIRFDANESIVEQNMSRMLPDPISNSEEKSTERFTIDNNEEICEYCHKKVLKSNLKRHLDTQHGDGMSKYSCFLCKQNFRTTENLNSHIKKHFRAKPMSCLKCVAIFQNKESLEDHVLKMHPHKNENVIINLKPKVNARNVHDMKCQIIVGNKCKNFNNYIKLKRVIDNKNVFKVDLNDMKDNTESSMNLRKYIESFSSNKSSLDNLKSFTPCTNVILKRITHPIVKPNKFTLQTFQISNSEPFIGSRALSQPVKFSNNAKIKLSNRPSKSLNTNIDVKLAVKTETKNHVADPVQVYYGDQGGQVTGETSKVVDISYHKYLEALKQRGTCQKKKKDRGKVYDYVSIIASELSDASVGLKKK